NSYPVCHLDLLGEPCQLPLRPPDSVLSRRKRRYASGCYQSDCCFANHISEHRCFQRVTSRYSRGIISADCDLHRDGDPNGLAYSVEGRSRFFVAGRFPFTPVWNSTDCLGEYVGRSNGGYLFLELLWGLGTGRGLFPWDEIRTDRRNDCDSAVSDGI